MINIPSNRNLFKIAKELNLSYALIIDFLYQNGYHKDRIHTFELSEDEYLLIIEASQKGEINNNDVIEVNEVTEVRLLECKNIIVETLLDNNVEITKIKATISSTTLLYEMLLDDTTLFYNKIENIKIGLNFELDRNVKIIAPTQDLFIGIVISVEKHNINYRIKKIPKQDKINFLDNYLDLLAKYETENIFEKKENILDVCVKQIEIENYQGIKKISISKIPIDTQWIFFTGENGYGKTSILQAIAIAFFGNKDNGQILDKKEKIKYLIEYKNINRTRVNTNKNWADKQLFLQFDNFAVYGASRLNKNVRPFNNSKTYSLFNSYSELFDIEDKLIRWEKDEIQNVFFESAKNILLQLMSPHIKDIIVERSGSTETLKYEEFENSDLKEFHELASGYKSIIAMVGDMLIRLSEKQATITNFNQLFGIVVIDEFDLHLHPKWQRSLVIKLTKIFPKIQFIVSTHSPIPLLGAPKNSVVLKVDRNKIDGITAKIFDIDISVLTPNSLLTSPIFGFDDINSNEIDIRDVETADRYETIQNNKILRKKLNILKQNDEVFFKDLIAKNK